MRFIQHSSVALFLSAALSALPVSAASPTPTLEERAILAPIQAMFDGMTQRDATAILQPLLPGGSLVLMRDGKPTQITFAVFAERVGKPGKAHIEERIHDPIIHIDRDLAVVWAPFDFLSDGKVDHCGTDLFNLVRNDGKWLIASVTDTGHPTCPAH